MQSLMFASLCRLLSDRLGVLLHGGWRRRRHADLHLAVVFRWEEAETLPILRSSGVRRIPRAVGLKGEDSGCEGLTPAQRTRHQRRQIVLVHCTSWDTLHQTTAGTLSLGNTHRRINIYIHINIYIYLINVFLNES